MIFKRTSHGPWKSFSRSIHAWNTHNNLGISIWVIPSRPGSFILKDISSYLFISNSVPLHMSENTNTMGLHTTYLWVHTYWANLIKEALPQRKGNFSFSMLKRHRKCIIGACCSIYGPGVKSHYTINEKVSEGRAYMLPCLFSAFHSTAKRYWKYWHIF